MGGRYALPLSQHFNLAPTSVVSCGDTLRHLDDEGCDPEADPTRGLEPPFPHVKSKKPNKKGNNQQDANDCPDYAVSHVSHPLRVVYHIVFPVCNLPRRFNHMR